MNAPSADLSGKIIGGAIRVHETLGPGFLESIYEETLCVELGLAGLQFERQIAAPIIYRERKLGEHRLDLLVERQIVVELKAVTGFEAIYFATLRSCLKAIECSLGLLINFAAPTVQVKRVGREWHSKAAV